MKSNYYDFRDCWYALFLAIIKKNYTADDAIRAMRLEKVRADDEM